MDQLFTERIEKIRKYFSQNKRLPSYQELADMFSIKSKGAVYKYVQKFIDAGLVEKDENGTLIPTTDLFGLRVLGNIQAGFPVDVEEEFTDTISLDQFLIDRPEATYMLRVDGDSMIEAGIVPGDLVVVDRGRSPLEHDIVVAEVDGEWTLKYLIKERGKTVLRPANKEYPDIRPQTSLKIGGVVTSVVRKY